MNGKLIEGTPNNAEQLLVRTTIAPHKYVLDFRLKYRQIGKNKKNQ